MDTEEMKRRNRVQIEKAKESLALLHSQCLEARKELKLLRLILPRDGFYKRNSEIDFFIEDCERVVYRATELIQWL
jgi:hypothetical protein